MGFFNMFQKWLSSFLMGMVLALIGQSGWVHASVTEQNTLEVVKKRGVLIVGVKKDVPLWGMLDPKTGDYSGLEVDMAADLAKRLGVKLRLVGVLTSERLDFIESRKVDVMIATVANTPDRRPVMTFVKPHYHASGTSVVSKKSTGLKTWADVKNRRICSRRDAYFNRPVSVEYGADIVALFSANHAIAALKDGRCAGFLYGDTQISAFLADPEFRDRYEMALPPINTTPWGIVIHRLDKDSDFEHSVSQVLIQWFKEGTISNMQKQWGLYTPDYTKERERRWQMVVDGKPYCGDRVDKNTPEDCL